MNHFEKQKFTDVNQALDYILPGALPSMMREPMKQQLKGLLQEEYLIDKANRLYFNGNSEIYLDFFLKYLLLAGEKASLITVDNNTIALASIFSRVEQLGDQIPSQSLPSMITSMEDTVWLRIENIKNARLKQYFDKIWQMSEKIIENEIYYVQLLPATTFKHMDELYRAICTYL